MNSLRRGRAFIHRRLKPTAMNIRRRGRAFFHRRLKPTAMNILRRGRAFFHRRLKPTAMNSLRRGMAFFHRRLKPTAMNSGRMEFTLKSCKLFSAIPSNPPLEKREGFYNFVIPACFRLSENETIMPGLKGSKAQRRAFWRFLSWSLRDFEANRTFSDSLLLAGIHST